LSAHVQTGPGAHPVSYTMGPGCFPGVKRPECGIDYPFPSSALVKERVELYLYCSRVNGLCKRVKIKLLFRSVE
jgi:hypothetical protein